MLTIKIMVGPGHFSKALCREGHNNLRGLEALAGPQIPGEFLLADTHDHPNGIKLGLLHLADKVSGIYKMHGIYLALLLISSRCHKGNEGVFLVAGFSFCGGYQLLSIAHPSSLNVALPGPGSVKGQELKIFIVHIQAGTVNLLKFDFLAAFIGNLDTSCDHILFFKDRISQL